MAQQFQCSQVGRSFQLFFYKWSKGWLRQKACWGPCVVTFSLECSRLAPKCNTQEAAPSHFAHCMYFTTSLPPFNLKEKKQGQTQSPVSGHGGLTPWNSQNGAQLFWIMPEWACPRVNQFLYPCTEQGLNKLGWTWWQTWRHYSQTLTLILLKMLTIASQHPFIIFDLGKWASGPLTYFKARPWLLPTFVTLFTHRYHVTSDTMCNTTSSFSPTVAILLHTDCHCRMV